MKKIFQKIILILFIVTPSISMDAAAGISDVFTDGYVNNASNSTKYASTTFNGHGSTGTSPGYVYFRYSKVKIPPIFCNDIYGSDMLATKEQWRLGSNQPFSVQIDDLEPDTRYSFCAVMSNYPLDRTPTDIAYGGVITFTTLPCSVCQQVNVTTDQGSATNQSTAYINGSYNSTKASRTYFEYKKDITSNPPQTWTKVGTQTHPAGASGNINFTLTNLSASTPYKYRAVIEARKPDATCTSQSLTIPCYEAPIYGVDKDFTTIAAPLTITTTGSGVTYGNTGWNNFWNSTNYTGNTDPINNHVVINGTNPNCPQFKVNQIPDQIVFAGSNLTFNASVCGGIERNTTYSARNIPDGAQFTRGGRFSWTPRENQVGTYYVTINAQSGTLSSVGSTVKIYVIDQIDTDPRLTIYPLPSQNIPALSTLAFSVNSYNTQGKPVSYSSSNVPSGATLSRDGIFEWTPEIAQVGVYTMTINASTELSRAIPINVLISVTDINNQYYINTDPINPICLAASPNYDPTNPICNISNYSNFCVVTSPNYNPSNPICSNTQYTNICLATSPNYDPTNPICGSNNNNPIVPQCSNGVDDDDDGKVDFPLDENCTSTLDYSELAFGYQSSGTGNNTQGFEYDYSGYTGIPFTGSGTIGGGIFGSSSYSGNGFNGSGNNGNGNNNGNGFNGSGNNGGMTPPPKLGSVANPLSDAIVHYHEGVETVFTRQIMHYPGFAKLYGYVDGANLQSFADTLSHTFAQIFGYYAGGGREIRVTVPDMAAYEFGLKDGMLAVYEYYDNHLTGISVVTGKLKSAFEYEYYYTKR